MIYSTLYKNLSMNIFRIFTFLTLLVAPILFIPNMSYAACDDLGQPPCQESVPIPSQSSDKYCPDNIL